MNDKIKLAKQHVRPVGRKGVLQCCTENFVVRERSGLPVLKANHKHFKL